MGYVATKKHDVVFKVRFSDVRHRLYWTHRHGVITIVIESETAWEAETRAKQIVAGIPVEIVGEPFAREHDKAKFDKAAEVVGMNSPDQMIEHLGFAYLLIPVPLEEGEYSDVEQW